MLSETLKIEILKEAKRYVEQADIPVLPVATYEEYLMTGNRLAFEKHYFERRRQLTVLGLAFYLEKSNAVKEQLEQVIWEICNEYAWSLPAHLPVIDGAFGLESSEWLDLFSAETAQALSELDELVGDALSPFIRQRINEEVNRRVLVPLEKRRWDWEFKENNWSSVIAGAIGLTALSLLPKNSPRQKQIIQRLDLAMQSYLMSFGEDGACVEGVGYWAYGFGYYLYYAQKLAEVTGDTTYLELEKVKKIAAFPYFTMQKKGEYVPFSDYSAVDLPTGLMSFCATYFQVMVPEMAQTSPLDFDHCYRFAHVYRNLTWDQPTVYTNVSSSSNHFFADVQWWIVRDQENQLFFAARGGNNAESHNHLDVGHFIFGSIKELLLTDIGAGEYTKDYFNDSLRYQIFPNSALSHSVPQINGAWQIPGKGQAKVIKVNAQQLTLDLTAIYPEGLVKKFERHFSLEGKTLKIVDEFAFEQPRNEIIANFVSAVKPHQTASKIELHGQESKGYLQLDASFEEQLIFEKTYVNHQGIDEIAYVVQGRYERGEVGKIETVIRLEG